MDLKRDTEKCLFLFVLLRSDGAKVRHCERSVAIQAYCHFNGLPRYARNDELSVFKLLNSSTNYVTSTAITIEVRGSTRGLLNFDISTASLPVDHLKALVFQTTQRPEALLLLEREGGVLISCDSIKNWIKKDRFFDEETFELMNKSGSIGEALIDRTWLSAMRPENSDLEKILKLNFKHLLSAHGEVLKNTAKAAIKKSIEGLRI